MGNVGVEELTGGLFLLNSVMSCSSLQKTFFVIGQVIIAKIDYSIFYL